MIDWKRVQFGLHSAKLCWKALFNRINMHLVLVFKQFKRWSWRILVSSLRGLLGLKWIDCFYDLISDLFWDHFSRLTFFQLEFKEIDSNAFDIFCRKTLREYLGCRSGFHIWCRWAHWCSAQMFNLLDWLIAFFLFKEVISNRIIFKSIARFQEFFEK